MEASIREDLYRGRLMIAQKTRTDQRRPDRLQQFDDLKCQIADLQCQISEEEESRKKNQAKLQTIAEEVKVNKKKVREKVG